jgi:hypothetical protein
MPSAQDCAERLREQAYRTLLPQIRDLEQELQKISAFLSTGFQQVGQKLEALNHIELPTTEVVLNELLGDVTRDKDLQTGALAVFAHSLRSKETQEEILALLLDGARKYFARTALFAIRGNRFVGWSSRGFSEDLARNISSCSFLRADSPELEEVLQGGSAVTKSSFPEQDPLRFLQEEAPGDHVFVPLNVLQRPVAVLLAQGGDPAQNCADALSILAEFAVLRLENIALKILYELTSAESDAGVPAQEIQTAAPEPVAAAPVASPEPAPPAPVAAAAPAPMPEPVLEPEPDLKFDIDAIQPTPPVQPEPVEETIPFAAEPEPEEVPPVDMRTQEEAPAVIEEAEAPEIPPQEVRPATQEIRPVPEEEKLHSDAKRFARLLVSEIKLYNEHHVIEGRENQDLYLRLKRDIDRSREMYEKRVSANVSRKIDYFHDEIIRILGDNDPSTLGSDYPGPRVES